MNSKLQLAHWARAFGKSAPIGVCWERASKYIGNDPTGEANKYSREHVLWAFYTGWAQDVWEGKPNYLCNSCRGPRMEPHLPHCKIPGFHHEPTTLRYNRGLHGKPAYGPRVYHVGADGLRTEETTAKITSATEKAKAKKKRDNKKLL